MPTINRVTFGVLTMLLAFPFGVACSRPAHAADSLPEPEVDLPAPGEDETTRIAVFAAGCFWCVEAVFEPLRGVVSVVSGYAGGTEASATYDAVSAGRTRHAEAVEIVYDPREITYGELLRVLFATHDPTTKDRQGPDRGPQYRSTIFYANDQEKYVAQKYIDQLTEAEAFDAPIVTTLEPLEKFHDAEKYHQDFVRLNPDHPYVRQWALPKIEKVRKQFGDELKDAEADQPAATQPSE